MQSRQPTSKMKELIKKENRVKTGKICVAYTSIASSTVEAMGPITSTVPESHKDL